MSKTTLTPLKKAHVWVRAAGRCEICNCRLDVDSMFKVRTNIGEHAHIVADSEKGPRGDAYFSPALGADIGNILLLCEEHHKLIDGPNAQQYPVAQLHTLKANHEERVRRLFDIDLATPTQIVTMYSPIGDVAGNFDPAVLNRSVVLNSQYTVYPAADLPLQIDIDALHVRDHDAQFWSNAEALIRKRIEAAFEGRAGRLTNSGHISVFAFAPMPTLMALGKALGDKRPMQVFQYDRLNQGWLWPEGRVAPEPTYQWTLPPTTSSEEIALDLSLSFNIDQTSLADVAKGMPMAKFCTTEPDPNVIAHPQDLVRLRHDFRAFLSALRERAPQLKRIHLFPAAPISACVEIGRCLLPKADSRITVYDYQREQGGFVQTLTL